MNDAEFEATCDRLRAITDRWAADLVPSNVEAQRYFHRSAVDFEKDGNVGHETDAFARCRWQYLSAEIHFNVEALWQTVRDDAYLEKVIVHELTHSILDELVPRDKAEEFVDMHNERVTSALTHAFISVRNRAKTYQPVEGEY